MSKNGIGSGRSMKMMVQYVHDRLKEYPFMNIGVDMTLGNGHDTEFLLTRCQKVYAFDIQEEAFIQTKKRIGNNDRVQYIHDSHEYIDKYLEGFDVAVFNLGYLPQASHHLTTLLSSTQIALKKAIEMATTVIFIVVYPGHEEGLKESQWIDEYVSQLDSHMYHVSTYRMLNKTMAPYVIEIEKKSKVK